MHVKDVQRRPVADIQIGVEGDGGSTTTGDDGKGRIPLAKQTKEKTWVSLQILKSPPLKDLAMVSPWDYRTMIPPFENESENFVEIVVVLRGDRTALESASFLKAFAEKINEANAPKTADKQAQLEDPKAKLEALAEQYGLNADDIDRAIRAWGAKATDPYDAGLAALYERKYSKASNQLMHSLQQREERLASDQKSVADAAFFLGQSLYEEGKYQDSAAAYQRCLQLRPDDWTILNNLALSLAEAGDPASAEPLYRRSLALREKVLGPDHPLVAISLDNLAVLLAARGEYAAAETLFRRALAIVEKVSGPNDPHLAMVLNNIGGLLEAKGNYSDAEPYFQRALTIDERAFGPDHPRVAMVLNNLGRLMQDEGNYAKAESLYRRALEIEEEALGQDHPDVAKTLNSLATLLQAEGKYDEAEPLYRHALAIDEKALGTSHPQVASDLNNLGALARDRGDLNASESFF